MLSRLKQLTLAAAGIAALALGGSALAGAASTTTAPATTSTTSSPSSTAPEGAEHHGFPTGQAPGSAAHESSEATVTGADASKAQAAAVKSVPGTAGAVTRNFTKDGYEVTVTKSDGSTVTVHIDSSFKAEQGH